jgi:hypothetical protein
MMTENIAYVRFDLRWWAPLQALSGERLQRARGKSAPLQ